MKLNTVKPALGANRNRKRIGRGPGSGHGKTATKGHKGQKARSGGSVKAGFEGGQMPMQRRLPKRGFKPLSRTEYAVVNLSKLNRFDPGSIVDCSVLCGAGLVGDIKSGIKILGTGNIDRPLHVKVQHFSESARSKIIAAGGTAEEI